MESFPPLPAYLKTTQGRVTAVREGHEEDGAEREQRVCHRSLERGVVREQKGGLFLPLGNQLQ